MFGIAGAHRSGKTTLALALSESLGIKFLCTNASGVAKDLGVNLIDSLGLSDRLSVQEALLDRHVLDLRKQKNLFITDRTPIDMASYMMCEVRMADLNGVENDGLDQRIAAYVERCVDVTKKYYGGVMCIEPLDTYEVLPNKPWSSIVYQAHIQSCIFGLLMRTSNDQRVYYCRASDLTERMNCGIRFISDVMDKHDIPTTSQTVH